MFYECSNYLFSLSALAYGFFHTPSSQMAKIPYGTCLPLAFIAYVVRQIAIFTNQLVGLTAPTKNLDR